MSYLGWHKRWTVMTHDIVTIVVVSHRCGGWGMEVVEAALLIVCGHGKSIARDQLIT